MCVCRGFKGLRLSQFEKRGVKQFKPWIKLIWISIVVEVKHAAYVSQPVMFKAKSYLNSLNQMPSC